MLERKRELSTRAKGLLDQVIEHTVRRTEPSYRAWGATVVRAALTPMDARPIGKRTSYIRFCRRLLEKSYVFKYV